ncbi:sodium:solute symporter [Novipirellula artificiosorum]|uniref:Sodium/glucose cotransporter n=1 Tax=Novipirellula artificiosorum TaxID=2528016 RepID=A0A5C6DMK0_9BACT|nr:sodium:solute symporter [Novipirellula artificiosorum]TWU37374.1 Sodium/glucose cotransporter [Novipirellula artificiosorum]
MHIHWIDLTIIIVYLLGITGIGCFSGRHQADSSSEYFLAARSLRWPVIGLALFATNISTVHLIGLASSGYSDGMVIGNFEWMAPFLLVLLGLVFAPFYFRTKIATLPEYLEGRYGPASRTILAFMAIIAALFIHIGVTLYAGAVMFQSFVEIDILWSILIVSALTLAYTALGGLKAVVVTESIQTVLLLLGAASVTVFGILALGERGIDSLETLREAARPNQLSMIRTDGEFAWYVMLLGYPVLGIWYWCSDQTIVQRVLGAETERDAQIGPLFAGIIKVLPVFFMVLPGVIGYVLFQDQIADNPDQTLIVMIQELLPVGIRGLVIAGLLAALMSTVAGALNSTATLVSMDLVKRIRPQTADHTLVRIGQVTVAVVLAIAIAWSTQGERFGGIFKGINQMISVLAPPISAVFIWGVLWKRATSQAAICTLVLGFLLGAAVFCVDFPAVSGFFLGYQENGDPTRLFTKEWGIPFMMQAWWLFLTCSIILVMVSLMTPPPSEEQVQRYCWSSPLASITEKPIEGVGDPRVLSIGLCLVIGSLYYIFA